jgi:hypothetical protein
MITKPKNKEYGIAWTVIVDCLSHNGIGHRERSFLADEVVECLVDCEPRLLISDFNVSQNVKVVGQQMSGCDG